MQEMTMIERVARAISKSRVDDDYHWREYRQEARAAIEAMREPSLMMQSAALPYVMRQHQTRDVWRSMIDAALSE